MGVARSLRRLSGIGLLAGLLAAQEPPRGEEPPVLEYSGKPIVLPFHCTQDDIQWAGLSCSAEDPCPVYLELTAVEAVGNKLFTAGNIHSETITLYSVLLGSDDGGHAWREAHARIRGAGLDRIQFADFADGWASGESLFPLPQDPFLLITSDGGKTWRQQAVFSEPRPGSIQQMWFGSKSEGSLVIDRGPGTGEERYELYESPDGGESWNIKQATNQPIRLKDTAGPALWRVQPEGKTQSFRIEHQEGSRWTAASAFAVNLNACTPPPPESPSPPDASPAAPPDSQPEPARAPVPGRRAPR